MTFAALLLAASLSSAADSSPTPQIPPLPAGLAEAAALSPAPVLLKAGQKAGYDGYLLHEKRIALLAEKSERYDMIASGAAPVQATSKSAMWLLLASTALAFCGAGMWTGTKIR